MNMDIKRRDTDGRTTMEIVAIIIALALLVVAIFVIMSQRHLYHNGKLMNVPAADEGVVSSWHALVDPLSCEPGTVLTQESLGSHTITVSRPIMDEALQLLMDEEEATCVEIHYQQNGRRLKPAYAYEPEASAIYYVVRNKDIADGLELAWQDQGGETMMCVGTKLVTPDYIMKIAVACRDNEPETAAFIMLMDCFGGVSESHNTAVTFTDVSLRSFSLDGHLNFEGDVL